MKEILYAIIIILLIVIVFTYLWKENFYPEPTTIIMPELDSKCKAKYGLSSFYDANKGECYSCAGVPRNPKELVDSPRGCMGIVSKSANIKAVETCRQQFGNDIVVDIVNGDCYKCPDGYKDPSLITKKCTKLIPASYKQALIGRTGEGPDGLSYCSSGYTPDSNSCWKCGTGFSPTLEATTSNKKCRACTNAQYRTVQTCDQEYVGKYITDIYGNKGKCGESVGCDWSGATGGTRRCFCCPEGYIRSWDPVWNKTACVEKGQLFPKTTGVYWLRTCAPGGWPEQEPGETLAGGKYWKCPSGYETQIGLWEDPNKCCKFQGAMINYRTTCKDSYGGKTINNIKYSNNSPIGVGWDPSGKCFACPDGYVRTTGSVYGTSSCVKPALAITTNLDFKRNGQGTEGWEKCPSGYVLDPIEGKCWQCPTGMEAQILERIDSNNKCMAKQGPIAGVKMGKV